MAFPLMDVVDEHLLQKYLFYPLRVLVHSNTARSHTERPAYPPELDICDSFSHRGPFLMSWTTCDTCGRNPPVLLKHLGKRWEEDCVAQPRKQGVFIQTWNSLWLIIAELLHHLRVQLLLALVWIWEKYGSQRILLAGEGFPQRCLLFAGRLIRYQGEDMEACLLWNLLLKDWSGILDDAGLHFGSFLSRKEVQLLVSRFQERSYI